MTDNALEIIAKYEARDKAQIDTIKELRAENAQFLRENAQLKAALHESTYLLKSATNLPNDGFGWMAGRFEIQAVKNEELLKFGGKS